LTENWSRENTRNYGLQAPLFGQAQAETRGPAWTDHSMIQLGHLEGLSFRFQLILPQNACVFRYGKLQKIEKNITRLKKQIAVNY
jgi:hypothetical protein